MAVTSADAAQDSSAVPNRDAWTIAVIAVQLGLALLVIRAFELESRTFFNVMVLGSAGFVVHALLPLRWRLGFFVLLSFGAIGIALGWRDTAALLALGYVLIGICHLPINYKLRIASLLALGMIFASGRIGWLEVPWSQAVWPVLGSMFMFRLALYLYALKHDRQTPSLLRASAYFFMIPNVCFPLFPVVDYSAFGRNYFDRDTSQIYDVGMKWIARGLLQLILYRLVYLHLADDPANIQSLGDLLQFVLATFLLYLRVSGQFHLIIGFLYLFGFRLPETHHLYYLATSFTDFWRRINIYWKDFMMKLVYYPSYFRLRRWGNDVGLIGATIIVFIATWLLHSYQWFWLRGGFPLEPQDGLFWAILGTLVVIGALREIKRPRKRAPGKGPAWSLRLALSTLGTFWTICLLWSLWSANSVLGWILMWRAAANVNPGDLLFLGALLGGGLLIGGRAWSNWETYDGITRPWYRSGRLLTTASLGALLCAAQTDRYTELTPSVASFVESLRHSTLNARDAALQHKGYYENLDNASRLSSQLWQVQAEKPEHWLSLAETPAYTKRDDVIYGELVPGSQVVFLDQPLTVNRWGMRDREIELQKPVGTVRIALLGPSHVMGSGVADGDTFPDHLERLLNAEMTPTTGYRYEVLNFGVAAMSLLSQLVLLNERVLSFSPDMVIFTDSPNAAEPVVSTVLDALASRIELPGAGLEAIVRAAGADALARDGTPLPFATLRTLADKFGIQTRAPWQETRQRLRAVSGEMTEWIFRESARQVRAHDAIPAFLALDVVADPPVTQPREIAQSIAADMLVFNLLDLWRDRDVDDLRIASWDNHPNGVGQLMIATRIYELMLQHADLLRLDRPSHTPTE